MGDAADDLREHEEDIRDSPFVECWRCKRRDREIFIDSQGCRHCADEPEQDERFK